MKLIFLDDDEVFLHLLQIFFGAQAHVYALDVGKMPDLLKNRGPFDGLITDYNMPHQNGLAFAKWANGVYPYMPIVILSGHRKPDVIPRYIQGWLEKPIGFDVLDWEIRQILEKNLGNPSN
jgi:DNA-binding NtrC family response regulator